MSGLNSDIQSSLGVRPLASLTVFASGVGATNVSVAFDTGSITGFHALTCSLELSRVLVPTATDDVFTYKFQESDDGSTGWTDINVEGHLPFSANPERSLIATINSFNQTCGVFSSGKFVRLSITGEATTNPITITPTFIVEADGMQFTGYTSVNIPNDGQP